MPVRTVEATSCFSECSLCACARVLKNCILRYTELSR